MTKSTNSNVNSKQQELIKLGWEKKLNDTCFCWFHPRWHDNSQKLGASSESALRISVREQALESGKVWHYYKPIRYGFFEYGFVVKAILSLVNRTSVYLFHTDNEDYAKAVCEASNEGRDWKTFVDAQYYNVSAPRPHLLILKGKHGDSYFHVPTQTDFMKAISRIFDINKGLGSYACYEEEVRETYPKAPSIALAEADKHDAEIGEAIRRQWKIYEASVQRFKVEVEYHKMYERACNGEQEALWKLVHYHDNRQYETLEYEKFESLDKPVEDW